MKKGVLFWTILGVLSSYFIFTFIFYFLSRRNVEGAILAGTVTLSVIICYCTGRLLEGLKDKN